MHNDSFFSIKGVMNSKRLFYEEKKKQYNFIFVSYVCDNSSFLSETINSLSIVCVDVARWMQ